MNSFKKIIVAAVCLGICSVSANGFAKPGQKHWVPQKAWKTVQKRAAVDLGGRVKLYKSGWSKRISRGLMGAASGDAFLVHAKLLAPPFKYMAHRTVHPPQLKGLYLVKKSTQGKYEAFPVAPNARGKHISDLTPNSVVSAKAYGRFVASKVVHAVVVSGGENTNISMHLGKNVASKGSLGQALWFIQGERNSGLGAAAQVKFAPRAAGARASYANINISEGGEYVP